MGVVHHFTAESALQQVAMEAEWGPKYLDPDSGTGLTVLLAEKMRPSGIHPLEYVKTK